MDLANFFAHLDDSQKAQSKAAQQKEELNNAILVMVNAYAKALCLFLEPYIAEFEKRGYQTTIINKNLPYCHINIKNQNGNSIEVSIVNTPNTDTGFELAAFYNNTRLYLTTPHISRGFNKPEVQKYLIEVFEKLI